MKERCLNFKHQRFPQYGAKGIVICQRWLDSFDNFVDDMGRRPQGTTLDRIDSSGNYEPSNCRWATYLEQTLNTSPVIWIDDDGEDICINHFAKKYKIPPSTIKYRIKNGLSLDDLKKKPNEKLIYNIEFRGRIYGQREICREFNLPGTTFRRKMREGMSVECALSYAFKNRGISVLPSEFTVTTENFKYPWLNS